MNDQDKKEDSWIRKLPKIIVFLSVLIFIIIAFSNHYEYKKWQAEQAALSGQVQQTGEELDLLQEAGGTLQEVNKKVETLKQQEADLTVALEKLTEEKNRADSALEGLGQELRDLNEQVSAGKSKVAELTKESDTLQSTNEQLRSDIINKKSVLDSTAFLQRQRSQLENNIQDLQTGIDLAAKAELEQQEKLEALQNKIKEGEAAIQAQNERRAALNSKVAELTETIEKLSSQEENLAILEDHQKRLEYLEYLQHQKETLETSINDLLELGKMLEAKNLKLQQSGPAPSQNNN